MALTLFLPNESFSSAFLLLLLLLLLLLMMMMMMMMMFFGASMKEGRMRKIGREPQTNPDSIGL